MKRVQPITHQQVLKRLFKKRNFRQGYQEELDTLRLVDALIALRQQQGLTQTALAKRLKVSQPFIAKLERAETHNFTLDTLIKMVEALNGELIIHLRPRTGFIHPRGRAGPSGQPRKARGAWRTRRRVRER